MQFENDNVVFLRKENKTKDVKQFEACAITTDFASWFIHNFLCYADDDKIIFDKNCFDFAKRQHVYMIAPAAMFGNAIYAAKTKIFDSLENVVIDGPLYSIVAEQIEDRTAYKNDIKQYIDSQTREVKKELCYPMKKRYIVKYGVIINY
jgi:hypothetical protein